MRKFFATLLALVMVLSLMVPTAWAAEEDVTILYTNDVHTYIANEVKLADETKVPGIRYSWVAALKDSLGANTLLVDAGDHAQGTAYGSMDKGKTIIELMNAAGYDAATLGNHEFDYGQEGRINITDNWAAYPYLSCNFYNELDGVRGTNVLDAYKVFTVGGKKIAIVGVTTPESFTKTTPAYFQDEYGKYIYGISGGTDGAALYADVQAAIDAAKAEADIVIGLGHLGVDEASEPWTSAEVIANTTGFAAFIDGHSHSTVASKLVKDKNGNDVLLTQTGEYLGAVGKMTIKADGTITTELLTYDDLKDLTPDAAVKAIEDKWTGDVDTMLGEKIGEFAEYIVMDNYDETGRLVRKMETNTGDFAADALYYLFDDLGYDVDVAIMNGGGVRNKAISGDITYKTCKTIHTFGNVACLQTITGQQLLDALEWGAKDVGYGENGGFLQVSGIRYVIDPSIPSTVQKDEKGLWAGAPTGDYRVIYVEIFDNDTQMWAELDLEAEYNLAGYNYTLRDCGDGFNMFKGAVNVIDYVMEDYMVLANYVKAFPNGYVDDGGNPLTAKYDSLWSDYGNLYGSGRIEILPTVALDIAVEWLKDDEAKRPESATVIVKQNGEVYAQVEVTAADEWKASLVLPYYDEMGNHAVYTYEAAAVDGYDTKVTVKVLEEQKTWIWNTASEDGSTISVLDGGEVMELLDTREVIDWKTGEGIKLYVWTKEALSDEMEAEILKELGYGEDFPIEISFIAGEQALVDLGGVKADGKWNFSVERAETGEPIGAYPMCTIMDLPLAVEVTVTNTLKAPATGDAGVAIYMVMALVTLCGAAVLVSKKRAFN